MFREQQIIVKKHKKLENQYQQYSSKQQCKQKKEKRKNILGMDRVKHLTIAKIPVALRNMTTNLFKTQKTKLVILLRTKLVMN